MSAAVLCTAGVVGASAAVCGLPGSQSRQKCEPCLTSSMCTTGWCCPYHKLCLPNPAGTNTAGEAAGEAGGEAGANTCNLAKTSAQCVANCPDYVCGPLGCPLCTGCKKTGPCHPRLRPAPSRWLLWLLARCRSHAHTPLRTSCDPTAHATDLCVIVDHSSCRFWQAVFVPCMGES